MIPYGRQSISEHDIDEVIAVLKSDFLTQGPLVPAFEDAVRARCAVEYAVATSSATAALHIACLALGLGPGDHAWTVPNTFVASANCIRYCGATVGFVDIDPVSLTMNVSDLTSKLEAASCEGRLPKVLIPVHFAGLSCEMKEIATVAGKFGVKIIEDASHALGATYEGQPVGGCKYSDITVFSFHPVKMITTGEGGMALCNDGRLARTMRLLRTHGITKDHQEFERATTDEWVYEQQILGFNYRLTDLQAALGLSQLKRLDSFLELRRGIANDYDANLANSPTIVRPKLDIHQESSWHLYVVQVAADRRAQVFKELREAGIGVQVHYIPVTDQPYYRQLGFSSNDYPASKRFYDCAISLPMYPDLTPQDHHYVVTVLRSLAS